MLGGCGSCLLLCSSKGLGEGVGSPLQASLCELAQPPNVLRLTVSF